MKICPECLKRYDDSVAACTDDGTPLVEAPEELPENPRNPEVMPAIPAERTSVIDLEAIEAKRQAQEEARRAQEEADGPGDETRERTPPPEGTREEDIDRTGTLGAQRRRMAQPSTQADRRPVSQLASAQRVGNHPTALDSTGVSQRSALSRTGTQSNTQLTRGRTTQLRTQFEPQQATSGTKVAILVVIGLVAAVLVVAAIARSTAVLTVTTVPPGANVKLDGKVIGVSTLQKRVRTGTHEIELELEGYDTFKEIVDVPTGGLPFLQPLQKTAPPPPPPPTPGQIADEMLDQAEKLLAEGDLDGAKRKVDEVMRLIADHPRGLKVLAAVGAAIADREAEFAKRAALLAHDERLKQARVLTEEGRRLYDKNQLAPAKTKLFQAIQYDPEYPEPHRWLGRIYNRDAEIAKVRYHLERYLQLGGQDGDFKVREWLKTHPQ